MNTKSILGRTFGLAASFAALALLTPACASTKPPIAPVGANAAPPPTADRTPASEPTHVVLSRDIVSACGLTDTDAYFAFDSARLKTRDRSPLDKVVACFTHGPLAGHNMKLVGRADPRGEAEYNMTLGQSRADSVASYLEEEGLRRTQALTTSRGSLDATGTNEASWAQDRRVDVVLAD